jgi:hypothetical protein
MWQVGARAGEEELAAGLATVRAGGEELAAGLAAVRAGSAGLAVVRASSAGLAEMRAGARARPQAGAVGRRGELCAGGTRLGKRSWGWALAWRHALRAPSKSTPAPTRCRLLSRWRAARADSRIISRTTPSVIPVSWRLQFACALEQV